MSALSEMWVEALERASSEAEAVRLVAAQLGESTVETRRILEQVGRVKLRGGKAARAAKPTAKPAVTAAVSEGIDTRAIRNYYREQRLAGLGTEQATKATARAFDRRPHEVRRIVTGIETELQGAGK